VGVRSVESTYQILVVRRRDGRVYRRIGPVFQIPICTTIGTPESDASQDLTIASAATD
jgi:hypothetical protein